MGGDSEHIGERKRLLRQQLKRARRARSPEQRSALAEHLTQQLITLTQQFGARSLACYLSLPDEPDTRPFLAWAAEQGIRVVHPVSRADGLLDWAVSGEGEVTGALGVPEPVGERLGPSALGTVDLMLIPASAVDGSGMRLGWGRGYFDKTLASITNAKPAYALVFDDEVLNAVPREPHDHPVQGAVTPTRTLHFTAGTTVIAGSPGLPGASGSSESPAPRPVLTSNSPPALQPPPAPRMEATEPPGDSVP